jgi:lipopolysaccharide biosynthesis glycosyltransferase
MRNYITLISSKNYIEGVLVLDHSLKKVGSKYPLIVLVSLELYNNYKEVAEILNFNKIDFMILDKNFTLPLEIKQKIYSKRWINTFDKLQVFGLTAFSKIVFLDSDMLVVKNIDHLFEKNHLSFATASEQVKGCENWILPNSGMMVLEPEKNLPDKIFNIWPQVQSKKSDFSDQDLIQAYFADIIQNNQNWRVPAIYNCFVFLIDKIVNERKYNLRVGNPNKVTISVLHFAIKDRPWLMSKKEIIKFYVSRFFSGKFHEMKANYLYLLQLSRIRRLNR